MLGAGGTNIDKATPTPPPGSELTVQWGIQMCIEIINTGNEVSLHNNIGKM